MYGILSVAMESFITLDGPLLRLDEAFRRFHLLDHPKNLDGLLAACDELRAAGFRGDDLEHAFLDIVIPILKEWPDAKRLSVCGRGRRLESMRDDISCAFCRKWKKRGWNVAGCSGQRSGETRHSRRLCRDTTACAGGGDLVQEARCLVFSLQSILSCYRFCMGLDRAPEPGSEAKRILKQGYDGVLERKIDAYYDPFTEDDLTRKTPAISKEQFAAVVQRVNELRVLGVRGAALERVILMSSEPLVSKIFRLKQRSPTKWTLFSLSGMSREHSVQYRGR